MSIWASERTHCIICHLVCDKTPREKSMQLTNTLRRVMGLPCFYCKLAQYKKINNFWFVKIWETLQIFCLSFHKSFIFNCFKLNQCAIKTRQYHLFSLMHMSTGYFFLGVPMANFDSRPRWKLTKSYTKSAYFPSW